MKKLTKLGVLLLTLVMLVSVLSVAAFAAVPSLPDTTSTRILNLYKYTPTTGSGQANDGTEVTIDTDTYTPLANVEFAVYKVPGTQTISPTPTQAEVTAIAVAANLKTTMITDGTGKATYTVGTGNTNDGVYLIVEKTPNPAITTAAAPFYVSVPMTNADENGWLYTVNVYPKNAIPDPPTVDKDVDAVGTDTATHNIGDVVTWIIRGDVPADLYRTVGSPAQAVYAGEYKLTDTLDNALTFSDANFAVKLINKNGATVNLVAADYSLTKTAKTATHPFSFSVALTTTGMKHVQDNLGTGTTAPEIQVWFETSINSSATLGTEIPNNATLDFTNSVGKKFEPTVVPPEDEPEVHTGGLVIDKHKTGATGTKLSGATFKVARVAKAGETPADTINIGGTPTGIMWESFYTVAMPDTTNATKTTEVVTTTGGVALISGLAYGDYYLVETKAPDGYNLLTAPQAVSVTATSHNAANEVVHVANSSKIVLPITGGSGTVFFTMGGVLLIGLAVILVVASRKKKHAAE